MCVQSLQRDAERVWVCGVCSIVARVVKSAKKVKEEGQAEPVKRRN